MALFPTCSIQASMPHLVPGTRMTGQLLLTAPEAIERTRMLHIVFRTQAVAGYGSGKNRQVKRALMHYVPLALTLPETLPAGQHQIPFALDVPAWLLPAYHGPDCSFLHTIDVRVDVDWARDPKGTLTPIVAPPAAMHAVATPIVSRSQGSEVVVELTLASTTTAVGGVIEGSVALRSGHDARFDALEVTLVDFAHVVFGRSDKRRRATLPLRVEGDRLRSGASIPLRFEISEAFGPMFRTGYVDRGCELCVELDVPWATNPTLFVVPIVVLPRGSIVSGAPERVPVGNERLHQTASAMASTSGLGLGEAPIFVEGHVGAVHVQVRDSPRHNRLGVDIELAHPDVELGLELRPESLFDFGTSALLPAEIAGRFALRVRPDDGRPEFADDMIARYVRGALGDVSTLAEVRLGDQRVHVHVPTPDDGQASMCTIARAAVERARAIEAAIGSLPFPPPVAGARPAWEAASRELGAFLVPSGPTLHAFELQARVLGGDERVMKVSLATRWEKPDRPVARVSFDLAAMPLPPAATEKLTRNDASGHLAAVLAELADVVVAEPNFVVLEGRRWEDDPRAWMGAIEAFFAWALDARGEKRSDSPYR